MPPWELVGHTAKDAGQMEGRHHLSFQILHWRRGGFGILGPLCSADVCLDAGQLWYQAFRNLRFVNTSSKEDVLDDSCEYYTVLQHQVNT